MEQIYIGKIIRVGSSNAIVLPANILQAYNWQRGDHVVFGFNSEQALFLKKLSDDELRKLKPVPTIKI